MTVVNSINDLSHWSVYLLLPYSLFIPELSMIEVFTKKIKLAHGVDVKALTFCGGKYIYFGTTFHLGFFNSNELNLSTTWILYCRSQLP